MPGPDPAMSGGDVALLAMTGPGPGRSGKATPGGAAGAAGSLSPMAETAAQPLEQQLEEIGTQLAWVRDYL